MEYLLTREQQLIQKQAQDFVQNNVIPVATRYDGREQIPWPVIHSADRQGFWNLNIPQEYGGRGFDCLTECMILEELAFGWLQIFGSFWSNSQALTPILLAGTEEQKNKILPWFCAEPRLASLLLFEPQENTCVSKITARATRVREEYILNGVKSCANFGELADLYVVFATVDQGLESQGITAFLVPGHIPGLKVTKRKPKSYNQLFRTGEIAMHDVRIPLANRLGNEGQGDELAIKTLNINRPKTAAGATGLARRIVSQAISAMNKKLTAAADNCGLESKNPVLAEMAMQVESARGMVKLAAHQIDCGTPDPVLSAMAKCMASDLVLKIAVEAIQIIGEEDNWDYSLDKLLQDAKNFQLGDESNQILKLLIAHQLLQVGETKPAQAVYSDFSTAENYFSKYYKINKRGSGSNNESLNA